MKIQFIILLCVTVIIAACNGKSKTDTQTENGTDTTTTTTTTITQTVTEEEEEKPTVKQTETIVQEYKYSGEVMMKGGTWIIRVTDGNDQTDYFPDNLTTEFQKEGLKVRFSGTIGEIPKNVRMVGRPITLSSIEKVN